MIDNVTGFKIMFRLYERRMLIDGSMRDIYGLARLNVHPAGIGIGKKVVKYITECAEQKGLYCVVGFCVKRNWGFFEKCGWFNAGTYNDRIIITSKPVERIVVNIDW